MNYYKKNINGKNIQIVDYPGEKGPIIAIHGLTGTHKNMHYYAEQFKGEYRFIAVDLRGRGNSDETDREPSIFKHAEDILGLIKELKIERPMLLGHSMGAFISAIVASKLDSVQAVILLDGAAKMTGHQQAIVKPSLGRLSKTYDSKEQYIDEIKGIYQNLGIAWNDTMENTVAYEVMQVGDHWENKSTESRILADFESFYTFHPKEICSQITCPVLLVYAESKIGTMPPLFYLSDYQETQTYTKNLETVISDCNHYTMVFEKRDDINHAIRNFFKKISGSGRSLS
ncbi:alpha/beta fold hydrolase [Virgibacillus alimentarius]|uniref:Pimeloyl-ACP methyl ester carboxylesterase n=1 Tax=Virgibacillus alimentarius TaxID=698769 RepID=A0ABS4SAZ9_9BACI|nr:alpha/beta hydrolase [Virgibacillus alimentarius]MBP2258594.1 pimeloyl-ACP methyl ester carboxylesterase [Virgibacillus alimentarius]